MINKSRVRFSPTVLFSTTAMHGRSQDFWVKGVAAPPPSHPVGQAAQFNLPLSTKRHNFGLAKGGDAWKDHPRIHHKLFGLYHRLQEPHKHPMIYRSIMDLCRTSQCALWFLELKDRVQVILRSSKHNRHNARLFATTKSINTTDIYAAYNIKLVHRIRKSVSIQHVHTDRHLVS